ncbi:hypothetical protein ACE7GA_17165 [Roseomonas sp. CCTCC AB2023176]|uniref:hypothetical protein n=1 Tax=Roseomonas sp. CCTCC AB2023176 TaxID=3342640 RepID=UPI0035DBCC32
MSDTAPRSPLGDLFGLTAIAEHPDAILLGAIERYLHLRDSQMRRVERRGNAVPSAAGESWREMDALEAEIGRIPACTALGARAKLELALDLMPKGGAAYAIPTSALRDYLAAMDAEGVSPGKG